MPLNLPPLEPLLTLYQFVIPTFAAVIIGLWGVSIITRKVSFIDGFWGIGFVICALYAGYVMDYLSTDVIFSQQGLMLIAVTMWGLRLGVHLTKRFLNHGEDQRYVKIMNNRGKIPFHLYSLMIVFILQGSLILLVSAPVLDVLSLTINPISITAVVGFTIWAIGFVFETIADHQLAQFKANPDNAGKTLDTGLWAYSRHPNYFGEMLVWWGIWLISGNILLLFSPIFITFTLVKWSGIPMMEPSSSKSRKGYSEYQQRVSSFIPRKPQNTHQPE